MNSLLSFINHAYTASRKSHSQFDRSRTRHQAGVGCVEQLEGRTLLSQLISHHAEVWGTSNYDSRPNVSKVLDQSTSDLSLDGSATATDSSNTGVCTVGVTMASRVEYVGGKLKGEAVVKIDASVNQGGGYGYSGDLQQALSDELAGKRHGDTAYSTYDSSDNPGFSNIRVNGAGFIGTGSFTQDVSYGGPDLMIGFFQYGYAVDAPFSREASVKVNWEVEIFDVLPDIAITKDSLAWNEAGGVDFSYTISGDDLTQSTTVALYWSADDKFDPKQDTLIAGSVTTTATAANTYHVTITSAVPGLRIPSAGARYLLAVADPDEKVKESDETNNVQSLALPDLAISEGSLAWSDAGGLDFNYTISDARLPQPATVALYWSTDDQFDATQDTLIAGSVTTTATAVGTYHVTISSAGLGKTPEKAKYILAVANVDRKITEWDGANDQNNVRSLAVPDVDLELVGVSWNTGLLNDGLAVAYKVFGPDLRQKPVIKLYWSMDAKWDSSDSLAASTVAAWTSPGTFVARFSPSQIKQPPGGIRYVVGKIDPDDLIREKNEDNNAAEGSKALATLRPPVFVKVLPSQPR